MFFEGPFENESGRYEGKTREGKRSRKEAILFLQSLFIPASVLRIYTSHHMHPPLSSSSSPRGILVCPTIPRGCLWPSVSDTIQPTALECMSKWKSGTRANRSFGRVKIIRCWLWFRNPNGHGATRRGEPGARGVFLAVALDIIAGFSASPIKSPSSQILEILCFAVFLSWNSPLKDFPLSKRRI